MREKTIKLYTFSELSEDAQQKAIEEYRQYASEDFNFSAEFIFEDAATIADLFGLDIRQTRKTRKDGSHHYDPTIYYSGFSSQGDGACFEGRYEYKSGALKAVKDYAPQDNELHRIVKALQDAQRLNFYRIVCHCKHSGRYYHSGCMQVDAENREDSYSDVNNEDDFVQALRDFADWIYSQLEKEYEYRISDEAIREDLEQIYDEYTEDGERS